MKERGTPQNESLNPVQGMLTGPNGQGLVADLATRDPYSRYKHGRSTRLPEEPRGFIELEPGSFSR